MLILDEQKYAERLYTGEINDVKSIVTQVGYITRYHLHVCNNSDEDNYINTVAWAKQNHKNFDESCYSNLISDAIKRAHKNKFYNIDSIKITRKELEAISSLDNLRAEKILFVLLCMAKQQSASFGFTNGLVKYSLPELCKTARVSVPADDREYILYQIVQRGLLACPKKNNTQCLIVNFVDYDGDVVLELNEVRCAELAYEYLAWKNCGSGYGHCEVCGKAFKQSQKNQKRFCKECTDLIGDIPDNMKVVKCTDCGNIFFVPLLNTNTCRCETCQHESDKEYTKMRVRKYREKTNM